MLRNVLWIQSLLMALLMGTPCGWANGSPSASASRAPVLVELFTSEGCSDCVPADALLRKMDTQPVPGVKLIVLSEHVDYFNHDGWKDPYSSHTNTERQASYGRSLGFGEPYTPQMIADGKTLLLDAPQKIQQKLTADAAAPTVPVQLSAVSSDPAGVHARVDVDGASLTHNAQIFAALALNHAVSQVLKGENAGKRLSHVAVLLKMKKIGEIDKQGKFGQDIQMDVRPGTDPTNLRLIVFVQESGPGRVLGAAMQRVVP